MGPNDLLESEEGKKLLEEIGFPTSRPGGNDLNFKGLPFRGKPYLVDKDNLPVISREVHIKQFDLSNKDDMKEYENIFQDRVDGKNVISFEEKVYDPDTKSWRVLLRWYDEFYTEPKKKKEVIDE